MAFTDLAPGEIGAELARAGARPPNLYGLHVAYDSYQVEPTADEHVVCGGGESLCGGYGHLLGWLPLTTAHRRSALAGPLHGEDGGAGAGTGAGTGCGGPRRKVPERAPAPRTASQAAARARTDPAATLTTLLRGRVPVAHNLPFDLGFLSHEFQRLGVSTPLHHDLGVCTMTEATRFLPDAPRNLAGCCAVADIPLDGHHDALVDAHAAAGLLRHYLTLTGPTPPWRSLLADAARASWPGLPDTGTPWVRRGVSAERDSHFLTRILDRLPRVPEPAAADSYLALLDQALLYQALLDRHVSASEADALVRLTADLGLTRADAERLHRDYLTALAHAALADGVVTDAERQEIDLVASLLGLPGDAADEALDRASQKPSPALSRFQLNPGDLVVFTGEMDDGRETWENRARRAGYVPHPGVTKKSASWSPPTPTRSPARPAKPAPTASHRHPERFRPHDPLNDNPADRARDEGPHRQ
ncbi:3'-5' exonuclease [Planomonospora venezuelensis]|uniref:DNA polymerase-3 subunit epsilon n=1 Tax=Planomonospora venezuelensis TaxID=1999 RepID=A0A841DH74_PLAVE|nr:3'-5' exonuclease [Planomonospora venezuelensis]MBB5967734.1 DNA polymerase-3 subunit epsilon [Planomonospora venezuelensis]GIN03736.1 hypothetical protein Pve01_53940 [Planomonospora venezuelensis]